MVCCNVSYVVTASFVPYPPPPISVPVDFTSKLKLSNKQLSNVCMQAYVCVWEREREKEKIKTQSSGYKLDRRPETKKM